MNNTEQINALTKELELMRERYLKLADLHGQLQVQNSLLEERILSIVETYSNENSQLEQSLTDAQQQISVLQQTVNELQIEKQRYKDDCNLAVRLLHRRPNEFIATTSGQIQEQIQKNKFELTNASQSIPLQRSILMPTFPPAFVAPPPLLVTSTNSSSNTTETLPIMPTTTDDSLRIAAEAFFKSNSVNRSPSTQFICSDCNRVVKLCDVSVQTSLDNKTPQSVSSRLRLVSLTSSDDGHNNDDGWLSLESPVTNSKFSINHPKQELSNEGYAGFSSHSVPKMHHV